VLFFSGFQTGIDPSLRTAFIHGGIRFFTYALLGGLFLTFVLVLTARLAGSRTMPVGVAAAAVALQLAVIVVGDVGFAVLRPEPAVADAIAADPSSSPIAIAHEIARRNGTTPGRGFIVRLFPLLPALVLALVDPRRRPLAAGLAFGVGLYLVNAVMFLRSPAFAHVHPDALAALFGLVATVIAALLATLTALAFEARTIRPEPATRVETTAVLATPRA
jgi:hypothetical protein